VYEHTIFVIVHLFEICTQNVEKCCKWLKIQIKLYHKIQCSVVFF